MGNQGKAFRWARRCESETDCAADQREHPDDDQGPVPLTAHLQGLCNTLVQGAKQEWQWYHGKSGRETEADHFLQCKRGHWGKAGENRRDGWLARPTGQYKAPQGKYSSKVAGGVKEEW